MLIFDDRSFQIESISCRNKRSNFATEGDFENVVTHLFWNVDGDMKVK